MSHSPSILWIVIDSVRADHTSLHNYHRDTTPEMSRIASTSDGVNFEHCIAHSTRTPVSVPSMLTGLYPSQHRMIGERSGDKLPKSMTTAPELLSDVGYHTIGVSENGYAGQAKGVDERFDDFVKSSPSSLHDFVSLEFGPSLLRYIPRTRSHGPGPTLDLRAHGKTNSFFTTNITKRKLRRASRKKQPFFCYVHYNDPHHPYIPPHSFQDAFIDEIKATSAEAVQFAERMHDEMYEWMASGLPLSNEEWEMLYAMYDAIIKYSDTCIGGLFEFVEKRLEDTILVLTSDHGELFGEYGLLGHHMVLHDALIHVPLVTHGLDGVEHHVDQPTQHIDVMQTLLSLVGADTSQFQGYDLRNESREVAISQDLRGTVDDEEVINYKRIRQYNANIDLSHLPQSMVTSARTTDFKLVNTDQRTNLYELPDEKTDVGNEQPNIQRELSAFLAEWMVTKGQPFKDAPRDANLTKQTEQHLRDMGYL